MPDLAGQGALVTGAAQGLGRAIAEAYAQAGMRLVLVDVKSESLQSTVEDLRQRFGVMIEPIAADLADAASTAAAVDQALRVLGAPRVLVHNAAILINRPLMQIGLTEWQRELNVIIQAAFMLSQAVWEPMTDAGGGNLIYVSSRSGIEGFLHESPYIAGKHALEGLMKCLALEGEPRRIAVNTITPGMYMHTPMSERNYSAELKQKWVDPLLLTPAFVKLAEQSTPRVTGRRLNAWAISEAIRAEIPDPLMVPT